MPIDLTSRQVRTVEWMLSNPGTQSIAGMAGELRLSPRMVRSDLDGIERFLNRYDVSLARKRGVGVWLDGEAGALDGVRQSLESLQDGDAIRVFSPTDRLSLALFELLSAAPESVTVEQLRSSLEVSVTSARRDIGRAEEWLAERDLFLARQPGVGMMVVAPEKAIRRSLVKLLLETLPDSAIITNTLSADWWRVAGISAGIRDFLRALPLFECHQVVQENAGLRRQSESGHPWLSVDLAVTVHRIRRGRTLELDPGELRSLRDHPVWSTAESVASSMAKLAETELTEGEIGGLTEHLLGLAELELPTQAQHISDDSLVSNAVALAAEQLHPGLADDVELRRSLSDHIERLQVRLRYGLPVHNPLLREVAERYPDAHETAIQIAGLIGEHLGVSVSNDEAGFVTMYLSGALERLRLRPRRRAIVMCPAGTATAWILVSRIQAEFPELDIVDVLSASSIQHDDIEAPSDVIISTVDIGSEHEGIPVVVVGALLPDDDIRRVARLL
ncbi:MAG: PRD domain-containing protein [Acidimicrobiia bacterium]|nr:PRD domain-containing protein [Acidimicrobiia bacterium]